MIVALLSLFAAIHFTTGEPGADLGAALFTEITSKLGFSEALEPLPDGTYALPEITGSGVALFDYDNDGDLDILQIRFPPPGQPHMPAPDRLFQQQEDSTFLDVTANAGLGDPGYGQGVAVGDVDNDGDLDVYVTNFGGDTFYRNNGDGTFVDATSTSGFSGDYWSTSAAFVDYDGDGDLDLYVVHYVRFDPNKVCRWENSAPDYCGPQNFEAVLDTLYRNNGDGTFTDVSVEVGINSPGRGLGIVCADLTGDGWVDFYVANDEDVNQLWVNRGDGAFIDEALMRGVGVDAYGKAEGSMGITVGDVNNDGRPDLFITNLPTETNTLYISTEYGIFADESDSAGLGAVSLPYTGWGCGFFDFDHDGDLDLAVVNGRVKRGPLLPGALISDFWNLYAEPNFLFQNDGQGRFTDISQLGGAFTARVELGRSLAFGDIDRDGDLDIVAGYLNGIRVFRNDALAPDNHWLLIRAITANRDAIGAQVTIVAAGTKYVRLVLPGYSYLSSNDPRAHFGLGKIDKIESIEVTWPDGRRERFRVSGVDQEVTLRQGYGEAL